MTVIWDNCDIPSQLNTRSFLIGLITYKNMSQLTSGFSDNPRAVFSHLSGGKYTELKSGGGVSNKWNITCCMLIHVLYCWNSLLLWMEPELSIKLYRPSLWKLCLNLNSNVSRDLRMIISLDASYKLPNGEQNLSWNIYYWYVFTLMPNL